MTSNLLLVGEFLFASRARTMLIYIIAIIALGLNSQAYAQSVPGVLPFSTQKNGVDLATGNVNVQFPLRSKAGKVPFWSQILGTSGITTIQDGTVFSPLLVWHYQDPTILDMSTTVAAGWPRQCAKAVADGVKEYDYAARLIDFAVTDSSGASHPFTPANNIEGGPSYIVGTAPVGRSCGTQTNGIGSWVTTDDSGYTMAIAAGGVLTVTDKAGNVWNGTCSYDQCILNQSISDANRNSISFGAGSNVTDTLGATVLRNVPQYQGTPVMPSGSLTYADSSGANSSYSFGYQSVVLASNFNCNNTAGVSSPQDYGPTNPLTPLSPSLLSTVTLPDSGQYTITYEPTPGVSNAVTGRISKITLPSGGSISYAYSGGNNGINCTYGTVPTLTVTVADNNGASSVYTYASNLSIAPDSQGRLLSGANYQVTETDPANNQTVYSFNGELQTQVVVYQGSVGGAVLKTVTTCYNGNLSNCASPSSAVILPITQQDVSTSYGNGPAALTETLYDSYGNTTSQTTIDYGNVKAGNQCVDGANSVCTAMNTVYGTWNGSSCTTMSSLPGLPCDVQVTNPATSSVASETRYTYNSSGHPTSTATLVGGSRWLTTGATYNSNGTLSSSTDARGNTISYHYDGAGGCNGVVATSVTLPIAGGSSTQWDCNGGVVQSVTDANSTTTTYTYADPLWRLTGESFPDGGSTTTTYSTGTSLPWTISKTTAIDSDQNYSQTMVYDGLFRVTQTQTTSDPLGTDYVDTSYDLLGRVSSISNPHRSSANSTDGTTAYTYDALDRKLYQCQPDNGTGASQCAPGSSYLQWSYSANATTSTDEVGNQRQQTFDALGRLTQVLEYAGPLLTTNYKHDTLGNLTAVNQMGNGTTDVSRNRTYTYDSLSRLLTATNPENGTVCYGTWSGGSIGSGTCQNGYDQNGNLLARTDSRGAISNYSYDALNRLIDKTYTIPSVNNIPVATATPSVHYQYDSTSQAGALNTVGRLTGETVQQDTSILYQRAVPAYDPMGRVSTDMRCVPGFCSNLNTVTYQYDLAGHETSATTGGTVFAYTYDGVGRPKAEGFGTTDGSQSYNLMTDVQYSPLGGISASNGYETRGYDARGRTKTITYGGGLGYTATYEYLPNGNLSRANDSTNGNWTYGYDSLNRLTTANSQDATVGTQTYSYDSFGNKLSQTGVLSHSATFNNGTNRADCDGCYDVAGNLLFDVNSAVSHNYSYDAESRLSGVTDLGYQYLYDGEGERVAVLQSGAYTKEYFHDANGQFYSVFDGKGYETSVEFFGAGRHIFTLSDDFYLTMLDGQGTERGRYGYFSGTFERCSNLPFGDGQNCDNADPSLIHFTGKERDRESGLDYFGARYYSSNMGRFSSPDPSGLALADQSNPQDLNLYSYVLNNPLRFIDPQGLTPQAPCQAQGADSIVAFYSCATPDKDERTNQPDKSPNQPQQQTPCPVDACVVAPAPSPVALAGVAVLANPELGPASWIIGTGLIGTAACIQVHCVDALVHLFSRTSKVGPDPEATGPHSVPKEASAGGAKNGYTEYDENGNPTKRFRGEGKPHGGVKPPFVLEPRPGKGPGSKPIVPRPATLKEIPQ